jgi:hypothetical protein
MTREEYWTALKQFFQKEDSSYEFDAGPGNSVTVKVGPIRNGNMNATIVLECVLNSGRLRGVKMPNQTVNCLIKGVDSSILHEQVIPHIGTPNLTVGDHYQKDPIPPHSLNQHKIQIYRALDTDVRNMTRGQVQQAGCMEWHLMRLTQMHNLIRPFLIE